LVNFSTCYSGSLYIDSSNVTWTDGGFSNGGIGRSELKLYQTTAASITTSVSESIIILESNFTGTFSLTSSNTDTIVIDHREGHAEETYARKDGITDLDIIASDPLDVFLTAEDALDEIGEDPDKYKIYADGSGNAIGTVDNSGDLDPVWLSVNHDDLRPDENFPITEYPPYILDATAAPTFDAAEGETVVFYAKADDKFYVYTFNESAWELTNSYLRTIKYPVLTRWDRNKNEYSLYNFREVTPGVFKWIELFGEKGGGDISTTTWYKSHFAIGKSGLIQFPLVRSEFLNYENAPYYVDSLNTYTNMNYFLGSMTTRTDDGSLIEATWQGAHNMEQV
jgi:hypothetical protein